MFPCHAAAHDHRGGWGISRSPISVLVIDRTNFSLLAPPPVHHAGVAAWPGGISRASLMLCAALESSVREGSFSCLPRQHPHRRFPSGCSGRRKKPQDYVATSVMTNSVGIAMETEGASLPDHLLVLVHGILASPSDWKYVQGELRNKLGSSYFVHASSVNSYLQTLSGIDLAGRRLAAEVRDLVERTPTIRKVSFVAHSLGGLFSRYAIALLYEPPTLSDENGGYMPRLGTIAGLQPIIFITLATPHLGVRGKKQLPFLLGVPVLEKIAVPLAPFITGRSGQQLFLTDGKASGPPLLLRLASDCEEAKFLSALRSFKSRVLYANVTYDHMVGWRTSSIRREAELVKPPKHSLKGYKHVVSVTECPASGGSDSSLNYAGENAQAKEVAQTDPTSSVTARYHDKLEEEMIKALQHVSWRKVDVNFHSAFWPFLAHNHIHVKQEWLYYEGAGVVAHVADTIKEQDFSPQLTAKL